MFNEGEHDFGLLQNMTETVPHSPLMGRIHKQKDGSYKMKREKIEKIQESKPPPSKRDLICKPKCSEYCEFVLSKNKLLDRKLEKELKFYNSQMKTTCRLMGDKQRAMKVRYDKLSTNGNSMSGASSPLTNKRCAASLDTKSRR